MPYFQLQQPLRKLKPRKGGYFYLFVDAEIGDQFSGKKPTRVLCTIEKQVELHAALNHYGDGNYYIIVATRHVKKLGCEEGDELSFEIVEDPNPLGVEIPEVLTVLLDQEPEAKELFETLTDGRKRTLIHTINRTKDIDKQVALAVEFLEKEALKTKKK